MLYLGRSSECWVLSSEVWDQGTVTLAYFTLSPHGQMGKEKWTETRAKEKREPWANEGGSIPSRKTEGPEGRET